MTISRANMEKQLAYGKKKAKTTTGFKTCAGCKSKAKCKAAKKCLGKRK